MTAVVVVLVVLVVAVAALAIVLLRVPGLVAPGGPATGPVGVPGSGAVEETGDDLARRGGGLAQREAQLDDELAATRAERRALSERAGQLEVREAAIGIRSAELDETSRAAAAERDAAAQELERLAGLTAAQARRQVLDTAAELARQESHRQARQIEQAARDQAEARARHLVSQAVQRVASEQTGESVTTVVALPSEEMKGRIIGREGRNIRAFEAVTGVTLVVDDSPGTVLLSCFDPQRREVGRLTLARLVADGRIHPHQIESAYAVAQTEVTDVADRAARDAMVAAGVTDLHPRIVAALAALTFRTSYGQNVLKHLVECAHIARLIAAELGTDAQLAARCAFLHDIGKAMTHETPGSHAEIGAELAQRCGESPEVVHAIAAHHDEVPPRTVEAVLVQAADASSGGRPGARREAAEAYVARVTRLEQIAAGRPGVDQAFAMHAGHELRVVVRPAEVDDIAAAVLAREIAKQVETELSYPGQVRVTVVRESRWSETAT